MRATSELWFLIVGCIFLCVQGANKTFVPTKTWQTIGKDEAIPPGLHVRVNLQTGKKEAKLLNEDEKNPVKSALIPVREDVRNRLDPEEMRQYLKKLKGDNVKSEDAAKETSFKSYEEIKKEFEQLNLGIKTDLEVMVELIQEFQLLMEMTPEDPQAFLPVLSDLEYMVHQYDNAMEFARLGGFTMVNKYLNVSSDSRVRAEMLNVVGSSVQNNPRVQQIAVNTGCVTVLLKLLVLEQDQLVKSKGLFAISCLLRNFPPAQLKFVKDGGITVFSQLFDDTKTFTEKTKLKVVAILSDLLTEIQNTGDNPKLKEKYELLGLELNLWEHGWCQRVANWFSHRENWDLRSRRFYSDDLDNDMVEVTVNILLQLSEQCLADFVINIELLNAVNRAKQLYSDLTLHELDDGITDSIHSQIFEKLKTLAAVFARTTEFRDEL